MRVETIAELLAVVKYRGFSRAARQLYTSQSGLSARIAALEKELGFEVLDRSGTHVVPTPAGAAFIEQAHLIIDAYEKGRRDGLALARQRMPLRMGGVGMGSRVFRALSRIESPAFTFVTDDAMAPFFEGLFAGTLDLEIAPFCYGTEQCLVRDPAHRYAFIPIGSDHGAIAMSASNPLAAKEHLTSRDLDGATVTIGMLAFYDEWRHVIDAMVGPDVRFEYRLKQVDDPSEIARDDLGGTLHICSEASTLGFYAHRDDIVIKTQVDGHPLTFPLYLAYRTDSPDERVGQLAEKIRRTLTDGGLTARVTCSC